MNTGTISATLRIIGAAAAAFCCAGAATQQPDAEERRQSSPGGDAALHDHPLNSIPFSVAGNWGGRRSELEERGDAIGGSYVAQGASNARGGQRSRAISADQAMLGATLDLDRLAGMRDTTA